MISFARTASGNWGGFRLCTNSTEAGWNLMSGEFHFLLQGSDDRTIFAVQPLVQKKLVHPAQAREEFRNLSRLIAI